MHKDEYLHNHKSAKYILNIFKGATCGKNLNYIIHKM